LQLFAKLQQRSTLVFLQAYPTPQAASAASREEILATLREGWHTNPRQAAASIVEELRRLQCRSKAAITPKRTSALPV
jgi:hypothetical protein